MTKVELCQLEI